MCIHETKLEVVNKLEETKAPMLYLDEIEEEKQDKLFASELKEL